MCPLLKILVRFEDLVNIPKQVSVEMTFVQRFDLLDDYPEYFESFIVKDLRY